MRSGLSRKKKKLLGKKKTSNSDLERGSSLVSLETCEDRSEKDSLRANLENWVLNVA